MRPVDKGIAPRVFTQYDQARNHLGERLGWFCSYCEMPNCNMPEVEHMHPVNQGGNPLAWGNFLFSCKYCNTVKGDHNLNLLGYFWPDRDNTFRAFEYKYGWPICPNPGLNAAEQAIAQATINLTGIDREAGNPALRGKKDTRYILRTSAWEMARDSLGDWNLSPTPVTASCIARTAAYGGFFSIWMTVFDGIPLVRQAIIDACRSTDRGSFDAMTTDAVHRPGGQV